MDVVAQKVDSCSWPQKCEVAKKIRRSSRRVRSAAIRWQCLGCPALIMRGSIEDILLTAPMLLCAKVTPADTGVRKSEAAVAVVAELGPAREPLRNRCRLRSE